MSNNVCCSEFISYISLCFPKSVHISIFLLKRLLGSNTLVLESLLENSTLLEADKKTWKLLSCFPASIKLQNVDVQEEKHRNGVYKQTLACIQQEVTGAPPSANSLSPCKCCCSAGRSSNKGRSVGIQMAPLRGREHITGLVGGLHLLSNHNFVLSTPPRPLMLSGHPIPLLIRTEDTKSIYQGHHHVSASLREICTSV